MRRDAVMTAGRTKQAKRDKHFLLVIHDNWLRRKLEDPRRFVERYVREGQTAADLGCGPGFFTPALAETVGPAGKVFAVDSDERAVREVERKAKGRGLRNIDARAGSASRLGFIPDGSVDFVLCHGLLCSMAPDDHGAAVAEIKRILRPDGLAYVSVATGPWSYVGREEWENILGEFRVLERRGSSRGLGERVAVVTLKGR
jgi:ubiquinone/menaquinone biosynthesis C-methylase UbiE